MSAYRETPTVPAMSSISEQEYRRAIEGGMTIASDAVKRDTQRRIRLVAEKRGG